MLTNMFKSKLSMPKEPNSLHLNRIYETEKRQKGKTPNNHDAIASNKSKIIIIRRILYNPMFFEMIKLLRYECSENMKIYSPWINHIFIIHPPSCNKFIIY